MYIPHFIHSPFYVYAYAFGDCLVNSLYAVYENAQDGFAERYLAMLAAGGTKHYSELLKPFGLDAKDPKFWDGGLSVIVGHDRRAGGDGVGINCVQQVLNDAEGHVIHLYNMPFGIARLRQPADRGQTGTMKIEIKKIGNSDGLLLPRELMQRLDLKRGQELHITELAGGGFQAMPYDPDFEKTMEIADQIMDKYRDTLAALAK